MTGALVVVGVFAVWCVVVDGVSRLAFRKFTRPARRTPQQVADEVLRIHVPEPQRPRSSADVVREFLLDVARRADAGLESEVDAAMLARVLRAP